MLRIKTQTWLYAIVAGLALAVALALTSRAQIDPPCGPPGNPCTASGNFMVTDALYGAAVEPTGSGQLIGARLPTAGPLTYVELKQVEAEARRLLTTNKGFRQDLSPHQGANNFDDLVRQFDASGGFEAAYPDCGNGGFTLQECLDIADAELRAARDMYAYLAVYADEARFRGDPEVDCPLQPIPEDPFADPPVIDRCNFAARMRESLREAAYLRMIFGQQFTADALGFTFGANVVGGDELVRYEVGKLREAEAQFQLARQAVTEGLDHYLGNDCYVQSFYTEPEWDLLSRGVEGLERARHHIAVRQSYLAPNAGGLPAAQAEAQNVFRAAAIEQYLDLVLTANLATAPTECERGTRPDEDLVAKMVADLLATRQSAQEMQQGRNVFGFDVSFTPARSYRTTSGLAAEAPGEQAMTLTGDIAPSAVEGLWDQARAFAEAARDLKATAEADERAFDLQATLLREEIKAVKSEYDLRLEDLTGCDSYGDEAAFFTCVDTAAAKLQACDPTEEDEDVFNACVSGTGVGGLLKEAWENLRTAFLEVKRTQQALVNLVHRGVIETERSATVRHEILTNGQEQAAMEFAATLLDSLSMEMGISIPPEFSVSNNPAQPAIAALRMGQTLRQATADANIENANSEAVVRNLLLDIVELQIDLEIAAHKANAQATVFNNLAAGTKSLAVEARRARSYALQSPANDPSYRLVRNSTRLALADELERAACVSYMAAKRAEYEYAARLSASNFRLSDIYQARTPQDMIDFLNELDYITENLVVPDNEITGQPFTLSVAKHVLGWTDEELGCAVGSACPERTRRFREWVANHTELINDEPVLVFNFPTSAADNGLFSNVIGQSYAFFWLHKVAGIGQPLLASNGFGVNIVTAQADDLQFRQVQVTQAGTVHLKARSGCIFEYHLIHPAALLGLEWPGGEPTDIQTLTFRAGVNDQNIAYASAFLGRPVSATDWQIKVYSRVPGLVEMDLAQLEDIELIFDTTYASRISTDPPPPEECVRIDY